MPINFDAIAKAALRRGAMKVLGNDAKPARIDNRELLASSGCSILHFNRVEEGGRSMTIAYTGGRNIVKVATAVTHPGDAFTRKVGTKLAVENFLVGRAVYIPVPAVWQGRTRDFLINLFSVV